jgi:exodeoxyribonuclease-3
MTRIITANLNGIRSAARKGFFAWMAGQRADLVCIQELKAQETDLPPELRTPAGYSGYFHYSQRKGYSGSAIYTRYLPDDVRIGLGDEEFDAEGRLVELRFGKLSALSVYVPSGSSSPERQEAKYRFLDVFLPWLDRLRSEGREVLLSGDINIAHREIDLANWKSNQKNSGFLPEERAWLTRLFEDVGMVDVYRRLHPDTTGECYTWWSHRGQAYAKNVGWRLDYQIATPEVASGARAAEIYKLERFSDHAPLRIDYEWKIEARRALPSETPKGRTTEEKP